MACACLILVRIRIHSLLPPRLEYSVLASEHSQTSRISYQADFTQQDPDCLCGRQLLDECSLRHCDLRPVLLRNAVSRARRSGAPRIAQKMATPEQHIVAPASELDNVNVVVTPTSPSSAFTLSRFEFETGTKGNEGTKILMVEWDAGAAVEAAAKSEEDADQEKARNSTDDWDVRWDGKEALTVLPIRDNEAPKSSLRIYFLVPPGAPIPTLVTISKKSGLTELQTKPMPAIFKGLVSEEKGTRGVLHTIWAKKRLQELEAEITIEMKNNGESVGLEMALQEKQWIVDHFGLEIDTSSAEAMPLSPQSPGGTSPASPRSPVGGRLGEKLRGLKLATTPAGLAAAKEGEL